MPADYVIDAEHGVVFSRGFGVFTHADYVNQMTQLKQDSRFDIDFNQMVDCRDITLMDITAQQIEDLAQTSVFSAKSRRAFVASGPIQFGLSRMLASYREVRGGQRVAVFMMMDEALTWLNLPLDSASVHNGGDNGRKDR